MDTRCGEASLVHAGKRLLGKRHELMSGWLGKSFTVKLALIIFFGASVLLLPLYLTFTSPLRQHLIESSLIAARGTSSIPVAAVLLGIKIFTLNFELMFLSSQFCTKLSSMTDRSLFLRTEWFSYRILGEPRDAILRGDLVFISKLNLATEI